MAYEVKQGPNWGPLDYINPLKYEWSPLRQLEKNQPGYAGNRLQRALDVGDYDAAGQAYQQFEPKTQQELEQANQARRILSGREQQLKTEAEGKVLGQFKEYGDYDLGRQQKLLERQIAGQTAVTRIGADASIKQAELGAGASIFGSQVGAEASKYASLMGADASKYGSRMGAEASMYGSRMGAEASKYASQMGYQGAVDTARIGLQGIQNTNLTQKQIADMTSNRQLRLGLSQDASQRIAGGLQYGSQNRRGLEALAANVLQRSSFR
jgi:hypothetical protein